MVLTAHLARNSFNESFYRFGINEASYQLVFKMQLILPFIRVLFLGDC